MSDDLARLRAEMDQNSEAMREVGRGIAAFHRGLIEGGVEWYEALEISKAYVAAMAAQAATPSAPPETKDQSE